MVDFTDASAWKSWVAMLPGGKRIAGALYLHESALPEGAREAVLRAAALASVPSERATVAKFQADSPVVSLLEYPRFFEDGFPALATSWTVDLASGAAVERAYAARDNPPILHRKEQMLAADHPKRGVLEALTAQAESLGLFSDTAIIGRAAAWEEELAARGLTLEDNRLVSVAATTISENWRAERHRTALVRSGLSSPVQALWRHGFLSADAAFFDYGCGRGDDIALLSDRGLVAAGWDPWFASERPRIAAEIVNIGFVLNVIEDLAERKQALVGAWQLAGKVLSVAALIGGRTAQDRWRLYADGVLTTRGTFQKYYTHAELGAYIAEALGREPVAVQPGVYFVFRRDEDEQDFLAARQSSRAPWQRGPVAAFPRRERPAASIRAPRQQHIRVDKWLEHAELAQAFWDACMAFGRVPDVTEWPSVSEVMEFLGKPDRVLSQLLERRGRGEFESARTARIDDLRVYLALALFERRRSFSHLSPELQRDVRTFWGGLPRAMDDGKALLFSSGVPGAVAKACEEAFANGLGWLQRTETGIVDNLQVQANRLNRLPPLLRVYVGCAARIYGDLTSSDVLKIHAKSPKVTALVYDDFAGRLVPDLQERVKIDLRRGEIDVFGYGTEQWPAQPLWLKSRLMAEDERAFDEQKSYDDSLVARNVFDFNGFGPTREEVESYSAAQAADSGQSGSI